MATRAPASMAARLAARTAASIGAAVQWRGVLETLAVLACFLGFGLTWAHGVSEARAGASLYPSPVANPDNDEPLVWLIDGYNVLHAGLLGGRDRADWWTEPRRNEVMERVRCFDAARAELWVVFDGPHPEAAEAAPEAGFSGPRRVFADSADAWLLERVRAAPDPASVAVVTADRRLANRARHRGAQVRSPGDFLARCSG